MKNTESVKITNFRLNPDNPRVIRDQKFKSLVESIKRDPDFLEKRGIVHADGMILGGNQRYLAIKEALKDDAFRTSLGLEKGFIPASWVQDASEWPEDRRRRFVIVDNGYWGETDFDILANKWADLPLVDLGIDLPEDWLKEVISQEQTLSRDEVKKTLQERFIVPPFSVLDARQGYWQERKKAWLALGIRSELGRGEGLTMSAKQVTTENLNYYRNRKISPGGSPRPACDYSNKQRGDGVGRPING